LSVLLALLSALSYGTSDFLAGLMSRRASVFVVALTTQSTATVLTWIALPWAAKPLTSSALLWGTLAGAGAWAGTLFLYRGLALGRMSVVGPLSAVVTAAGSAITGVILGDRPTVLEVAGIATACVAVGLVSIDRSGPGHARRIGVSSGFLEGALAGAGFTLLFVALNRAGSSAGLWPVALSQVSSLVLVAVLAAALSLAGRIRIGPVSQIWKGAVPAGVLGGIATGAYFVATQLGILTISAVLASLYPAATVVLAVMVLRERLHPLQGIGLGLAAASVALLASRG
jgi:drug/metabolite transporter (DMT)-like permease